jgi:hypothetical protein
MTVLTRRSVGVRQMIVSDRMHWFLSIRQLIWNLFCTGRAADNESARIAAFAELERLLFKLVVGGGEEPGAVFAKVRLAGETPIRREGHAPGEWEPDLLIPAQLARLTFNDFYSQASHRVGTTQLVRLWAEFAGGAARNILIQRAYVDFFSETPKERLRAA